MKVIFQMHQQKTTEAVWKKSSERPNHLCSAKQGFLGYWTILDEMQVEYHP